MEQSIKSNQLLSLTNLSKIDQSRQKSTLTVLKEWKLLYSVHEFNKDYNDLKMLHRMGDNGEEINTSGLEKTKDLIQLVTL